MKLIKSLISVISEQLWLFALLTPILAFLGFGLMKWTSERSSPSRSQSESTVASWNAEVSSSEVAKIVTKPLKELLAMEIYEDVKENNSVASINHREVYFNEKSKHLFTTDQRNSSVRLVVYQARNKSVL